MATVERTLTINIRKEVHKVPAYKRAKKAITAIREHLMQHMKAKKEDVKIGKYINLKVWEHGIQNPITRITVVAKKDDKGIVTAELPNIPIKKEKPATEKKAPAKAAKPATTPAPATPQAPASTAAKTAATKSPEKKPVAKTA